MALMQSGVANLSRQLMRLSLLSSSYAASSATGRSILEPAGVSGVSPNSVSCLIPPSQQALLLGGVRSKFTKKYNVHVARKAYKDDEDAVHCHGFTYYPRFPNQKDPPIEPSKLFMVRRIRSLYGCPYWEKKLIRKLKLDARRDVAIFKNTPLVNEMLYKIKHLIEITPITMPYGLPDSPENGMLKENGELIAYNPLKLHGENASIETAEQEITEYYKKQISGETLKNRLVLRWNSRYDII